MNKNFNFSVGDKIRYLGTKCGLKDERWIVYFECQGIKKGSKGVIKSINDEISPIQIFIHKDGRNNSNGFLLHNDIMLESEYKPLKISNLKKTGLIKKIIKEIKQDKTYLNSIKNPKKEVESWNNEQILNWFKT